MSGNEDITGMEYNELLQQVHMGELNVIEWCTNEPLDIRRTVGRHLSSSR